MDGSLSDTIKIMQYLLPGFVAAWVFYSLTSFAKPSQFERVIQALIFTLFVQASVLIVGYGAVTLAEYFHIELWNDDVKFVFSVGVALGIGVLFAYFANNDQLHKYFREKKITRETSYPSEWFGAFLKEVTFVVLHMHDERRLYGWPIEWPSEPSKGHFVLVDPAWVGDDGVENRIQGVKNILVDVKDVKWVEFMEKTWE